MHYASSWKLDVIPVLLEAGASVNLLDEKGLSALWYAAHDYKLTKTNSTKSQTAIAALMAAGADPHLGRSPLTDCRIEKTMKVYIRSLCKDCDKGDVSKEKCKNYYIDEYDDLPLSSPQPEFRKVDDPDVFISDPPNPKYDAFNTIIISNALLLHKLLLTKRGEQVVQRKTELNRRLVEHTFELNYTYASENILLQIAGRNKNTQNASDKDPTESRRDFVSKVRCIVHLRCRLQMKFLD